jgi:hypothetical protein
LNETRYFFFFAGAFFAFAAGFFAALAFAFIVIVLQLLTRMIRDRARLEVHARFICADST